MSKQPTRMEQLGNLLTAMIAVIVGGESDLFIKNNRFILPNSDRREFCPGGKYYGISQCVAQKLGVTREHVNDVACGRATSARVRSAFLSEIERIDAMTPTKPLSPAERKQVAGGGKYKGICPRVAATLNVSRATVRRVILGQKTDQRMERQILTAVRKEIARIEVVPEEIQVPRLTPSEIGLFGRRHKYWGIYRKVAKRLNCTGDNVRFHALSPTSTRSNEILRLVHAEMARVDSELASKNGDK
jgi:hypothetical protein